MWDAVKTSGFAVELWSRQDQLELKTKGVDLVLDSIFGVIARCEKAKMRCGEIASLVAERLPALIEERETLEKIIHSTHKQRLLGLEASFENYCQAYENCNDPEIFNALSQINQLWGAELTIKEISDVQKILENPNRTGFLKWQD